MSDDPILVAGGGIGGIAAALALARKGRAVHVLEQADAFGEVGAGIQLGPNVFRMFATLGLTEAIDAVAVRPEALEMRDALDGSSIVTVPLGTPFETHFGFPYAVIYRPDLHAALLRAVEAEPAVRLETGVAITAVGEGANGGAWAETADGRRLEGPALIGADGLWSRVRNWMVGDGAPRVSGHIAYRAVLPTSEMPEHLRLPRVVLWAGPKTHLVQYPLHRGEIFNLVAVFHSDRYEEGWNEFGDPEELNLRFRGEHPDVLELLSRIESWRMWVLCDREPIREWSRGALTLLGDAAHPMLQYLAQGACMAIEDAVCLANQVEAAGDDFGAAFQAYQRLRYLRTARVQLTARLYGDVYHAEGATADLRRQMFSRPNPQGPYQGVEWLYAGVDDRGQQIV